MLVHEDHGPGLLPIKTDADLHRCIKQGRTKGEFSVDYAIVVTAFTGSM
jgi:hypothetical protein